MNKCFGVVKSNIPYCSYVTNGLFQKLSLFFFAISLSAFTVHNPDVDKEKFKERNDYREKVYLHIDKSYYIAGEDMWFKAYLIDGNTHRLEARSGIVYVDLISPESKILASKIIKIDKGSGIGDFIIPVELIKGEYTVRAYTNYMRNFDDSWFFRKQVFINSSSENKIANQVIPIRSLVDQKIDTARVLQRPDVQFFPEGGYAINGFVNKIAFKAVGNDGKGIDISGDIVDASGVQVVKFNTLKFGMGVFNLVPQKDQKYRANVKLNGAVYSYDLPASLVSGVVMQIIENSDFYFIIIKSSLPNGVNDFKLIGRQRNKLISSSKIVSTSDDAKITIPKNNFEKGIVQFTLFDNSGTPLCERLAFVETTNSEPSVNILPSQVEYGKRELVELEITSDRMAPQQLNANMSISVSDLVYGIDNYDTDIMSYLLLNSDLKGEIEHPGYYFYSDDPERKRVLDLLMMTQGWRQFVLNDTLNTNCSDLKFPLETGFRFDGHVKRFNEKGKPAKSVVSLIYSNNQEEVYNEMTTDDQGYFVFDGFDFIDSTSIIIQAKKVKEGKKEVVKNLNKSFYIVMDSLTVPKVTHHKTSTNSSYEIGDVTSPTDYYAGSEADNTFHTQMGDILIEEVTVFEKKKDRFKEKRSMYFEPSHSVDFNEIRRYEQSQNWLIALNDKIPSRINFQGLIDDLRSGKEILPQNCPLFILNGMPVNLESILSVPISDIDFVDVLEGTKTTIFGPSGAYGVIAIYTLDGSNFHKSTKVMNEKCILNFVHPGYRSLSDFSFSKLGLFPF